MPYKKHVVITDETDTTVLEYTEPAEEGEVEERLQAKQDAEKTAEEKAEKEAAISEVSSIVHDETATPQERGLASAVLKLMGEDVPPPPSQDSGTTTEEKK